MKRAIITKNNGSLYTIEQNDPTDIISECIANNVWGLPEREEVDAEGNPTGVILPAEYTIEIVDITQEHALQECIANRKAEYPTMEQFLNAYFDGGEVAVQALQAQRLAVKQKYPKP